MSLLELWIIQGFGHLIRWFSLWQQQEHGHICITGVDSQLKVHELDVESRALDVEGRTLHK
ncbi:hypothetical protein ACLOJK_040967 [Asimina triloba]